MQSHSKTLSLFKTTMGREVNAVVGMMHSVKDPDTLLRGLIRKDITESALINNVIPVQDHMFKLAGIVPDYEALLDLSKQAFPTAIHKMMVR